MIHTIPACILLVASFAFAGVFEDGLIALDNRDYDLAIGRFSACIRENPRSVEAFYNRGVAYGRKKEYDRAIEDFTEAIHLDPKHANAFFNQGFVNGRKKEYDKAIKDYSEAIRLDQTNSAKPFSNLAWLLATCPKEGVRDGKKAIEYATKACTLSAWKTANYLDTLAAAHAESGDFKMAVKRQQQAIELGMAGEELEKARQRLKMYQDGKPYRDE